MFIWIGQQVSADNLQNLFGVGSVAEIDATTNHLVSLQNPYSQQVNSIIEYLRSSRPRFMQLTIVRQGMDPQQQMRFANLMMEDTNLDNMSYVDYLCSIHRNIQSQSSK